MHYVCLRPIKSVSHKIKTRGIKGSIHLFIYLFIYFVFHIVCNTPITSIILLFQAYLQFITTITSIIRDKDLENYPYYSYKFQTKYKKINSPKTFLDMFQPYIDRHLQLLLLSKL